MCSISFIKKAQEANALLALLEKQKKQCSISSTRRAERALMIS